MKDKIYKCRYSCIKKLEIIKHKQIPFVKEKKINVYLFVLKIGNNKNR